MRCRLQEKKHAPSGFTLIEVLLSLVLLTVILGALYSSFFTIQRALERFEGVSLKYHEVRTALDIMRREIEGTFLYRSPFLDAEEKKTSFIMKDRDIFGRPSSSLSLTAFTFQGSGTKSVLYHVREKEKKLVLMKTEVPPLVLHTEKVAPGHEGYIFEVIGEIDGFAVEALFNDTWIKTWDSDQTGRLPELVRFSIAFDDRGKRITLTEYARPRIGARL